MNNSRLPKMILKIKSRKTNMGIVLQTVKTNTQFATSTF